MGVSLIYDGKELVVRVESQGDSYSTPKSVDRKCIAANRAVIVAQVVFRDSPLSRIC